MSTKPRIRAHTMIGVHHDGDGWAAVEYVRWHCWFEQAAPGIHGWGATPLAAYGEWLNSLDKTLQKVFGQHSVSMLSGGRQIA